jgi:hypothetical protein
MWILWIANVFERRKTRDADPADLRTEDRRLRQVDRAPRGRMGWECQIASTVTTHTVLAI